MCLFCYQRLQSEYNNTCPGCRQQYSDDLDGVRQHIARKQQQQKTETVQQGRGALPGSSHHPSHHHTAHHGHAAAASRAKAAATAAAKQRGLHGQPVAHGRTAVHNANDPSNSSLPPTSSWAVAPAAGTPGQAPGAASNAEPSQLLLQLQPPPQEPPPPAAGDESAWPSLGAAQPQAPPKPEGASGHERRRSSSSSLTVVPPHQPTHRGDVGRSSFESTGSTQTAHSDRQQRSHQQQQQDDVQHSGSDTQHSHLHSSHHQQQEHEQDEEQDSDQQQLQHLDRNSSGFTTVEVSTVVSGKRHDVCVHVSHAEEVKVYPEAAVLLDMMRQAVTTSKLSSTEAAVQLVQCLRKLEADSTTNGSSQGNWLQQVLAAKSSSTPHSAGRPPLASRAPPPGFGPAASTAARAAVNSSASGVYSPHQQHSQQQQQHDLPPAGWSSGPRQQQQQQQVHGETPQGSMHSVDSTNSLFSQGSSLSQSMWTDNGLPGVDLGVTRLAGGLGATAALPSAVPARLQMLWANGTTNGLNNNSSSGAGNGLGYSSSTVTGPPPGFGAGAGGVLGGLSDSRLNGMYNPLSFANAGAAQQTANIGLPPGFGLSAASAADGGKLQQDQAQQPSLYQPFH